MAVGAFAGLAAGLGNSWAGGGPNPAANRLYGMAFGSLFRVDPQTLEPQPGPRAHVGGHTFGWSFSPDRSKLVVGSQVAAGLRVVDLQQMRTVGDLQLMRPGIVAVTSWANAHRVLAVVQSPGCCMGEANLFVVDPVARRIVLRARLGGSLQAFARFRPGLVLLLSPRRSLGASRVVVVGADGNRRAVRLARMVSGQEPVFWPSRRPGRERRPGLAVDEAGGRAFVVDGSRLATVHLANLKVEYRELSAAAGAIESDGVEGLPASARDIPPTGPMRKARWLGRNRIAVAGYDSSYVGRRYRTRPSGLALVDVGTGEVGSLDPLAEGFTTISKTLVPLTRRPGLNAYNFDGTLRFRLFPRHRASVALGVGDRAFVVVSGRWPLAHVVHVSSGRVLAAQRLPKAQLLSPTAEQGWP